ncbi:MAG: threonine--tRNA ligase [Candidatus Pacebacteria bacterium]|nr:threonine--tRNA ligase [Candidatus Paceibacterota bacterium]
MSENNIEKVRHSLAHILACAIKEMYPEAKIGVGPAIDNGFYYDFDNINISETDLPKIEKNMRKIIKKGVVFEKQVVDRKEAEKIFKDEPYKLELLNDIEEEEISIYKSGDFVDLCSGPHIENSKEINPEGFKLERTAGAYFKGSEDNKMLQRIYGLAFEDKEKLQDYIAKKEDAEKRDHRKIGKKLELFMFDDEVGQGLPLYLPNGGMLRYLLMNFAMETYLDHGYEIVSTPHIAREDLWKRSGHLELYAEDMYSPISVDDKNYRLKPMNCPFHVKMYNLRKRSYRELPLRWAEMGTVYRYEKSGELHGLTRPRGFTQDDAHIICTEDQLFQEVINALKLVQYIYKTLGMEDLKFKLSVRDPKNIDKYFGDNKDWEEAEKSLKRAINEVSSSGYEIDEGGAVFYAPKIDIDAVDAVGRSWQLSTIQVDFNLPYRFDMTYINENGEEKTPFMIHRALLGSLERFLGVYIEHTEGNFPVWLSPKQVLVIPVSEKFADYAEEVLSALRKKRIRASLSGENETLGKKIRNGEVQKVPYLVVVGEKEKNEKTVSVRYHGKDEGVINLDDFVKKLKEESSI